MKNGYRKVLIILTVITINTIAILAFLGQRERLEQTFSYEEFSEETKEGRYEIQNIEDYLKFAETVSMGNQYADCEVVLNADLDFSKTENVPVIGLKDGELFEFKGSFNGNGHVIRGLSVSNPGGAAGMFANLGGSVKNLRLEDCRFEGSVCGAVTAQSMVNAVVANCYVDAKTVGEQTGTIAGKFNGYIFNCVITGKRYAGELRSGWMEQCYRETEDGYIPAESEGELLDAEEAAAALNQNLPRVSAFHESYDLCLWELENRVYLGEKKADLLKSLTATLFVHNEELKLQGYYSQNDQRWCIAVPAGYGSEAMRMTAETSAGRKQTFTRSTSEDAILFTWGDYQYYIDFLCADELDTFYITLNHKKDLDYIHKHKEEENPGILTILDAEGNVQREIIKGIYGHGNDSWSAQKKSYNLKMKDRVDLLGMGENEDFVLLAGYRDDSLMSYVTTTSLIRELEFDHAPEFRLVNLYVEGEYAGVYFLAEKIEIDQNRVEIANLYEETKMVNSSRLDAIEFQGWKADKSFAERYYYDIAANPEDISGGYLLEIDVEDFSPKESRFVSERGVMITMKRARCSSKEQVDYMADYWQEFENALFAQDGVNEKGMHYSEYIDVESFVMQWLLYELVQEGSMSSSIYYYKESDVSGDGLLHACFPWDMEHSYLLYDPMGELWLEDSEILGGYWSAFYRQEDFRKEVWKVWQEKFVPAINAMIAEESLETSAGMRNLRWYEERIENMSRLENSRWRKMNPYNRCQSIREFLSVRKEVLSVLLAE